MQWNWQQADWPNFQYDRTQLSRLEAQFLRESGVLSGTLAHFDVAEKTQLSVELISNEALKTSAIEGEYLNRDSVQSSIRRQFGLQVDNRRIEPAEQGIALLMVDLYQTFDQPLSHEYLHRWHAMLVQEQPTIHDIGSYRTTSELMQVVSGSAHGIQVHFEAPPSAQVQHEMSHFLAWFNETNPNQTNELSALTRAGIAHLYFVSIHPFEDGNGRIGRAIAEKALSQSLNQPTLIALAHAIEEDRQGYYNALAQANKRIEITEWLLYFAHIVLEAQQHTQTSLDFLLRKTRFYDKLRGQLNERQEKVIDRLFRAGPEGFAGGLSAKNYISITKTTRATATRDLQDLVRKGALMQTGQLRYTRYHLNI